MESLTRKLSAHLQTRVLVFGLFFLRNIITAGILGAEETGQLYFLTNQFQLIVLLISFNTEAGIAYYSASGKIGEKKLLGFSFGITALMMIVLYFFSRFIIQLSGIQSFSVFQFELFSFCNIAGIFLTNVLQRLMNTRGIFALPNLIIAVTYILSLIFYYFFLHDHHAILYIYFFTFPIQAVIMMICLCLLPKKIKRVSEDEAGMRSIFIYSAHTLVTNLVFFLVLRFDNWLIAKYANATDAGVYLQAMRFGQMFVLIPQMLASVLFAEGANDEEMHQVKQIIPKLVRLTAHGFLIAAVVLLLTGDRVFRMLVGADFVGLNLIMLLSLPGFFALSCLSLYAAWFAGRNKIAVTLKGNLVALVLIVAADFFFIPNYGTTAAALINSVVYSINLFYMMRCFQTGKLSLRKFFVREDYVLLKKLILKEK